MLYAAYISICPIFSMNILWILCLPRKKNINFLLEKATKENREQNMSCMVIYNIDEISVIFLKCDANYFWNILWVACDYLR